jgi:hypothetical protein
MLAEAGQYVRRERSYNGVQYEIAPVTVDTDGYESFSSSLFQVYEFSVKYVAQAVKNLDEVLAGEGDTTGDDAATGDSGASSTNFTSIMHNVINQMLLAMKANAIIDQIIAADRRGEKPVIALANTMESILSDVAEDMGIRPGNAITADFRDVLIRYLHRSRIVTEKRGDETVKRTLTDDELGPAGVAAFEAAERFIRAAERLGDLPISPIDYIKAKLEEAGISVGEITGRGLGIDYRGAQPKLYARDPRETTTAGKNATVTAFNTGAIKAIVLNQSGSTGLSLHASEKFKDKSQRHMFIVQAQGNIDTHMQVVLPK